MKAIVIHAAGDLRVDEIEPAAAPNANEVRIEVTNGGICGSDLHYFHNGGFGVVALQHPMALGHEVSGVVRDCGAAVQGIRAGDKVAINPSKPCGVCAFCTGGQANQCLDMRFNGSAMRMPHEQGLFRGEVTVSAAQIVPFAPNVDLAHAAMSEPLAVCLHAVRKAGSLIGKRVLVSGCGPIGCLTIAAAKLAGAREIIATDISAEPLAIAVQMGATSTIDLAANPQEVAALSKDKGRVAVSFECSGAASALGTVISVTQAGGTVVLVGMGGEVPLPLGVAVAKEITLTGAFRFDSEFAIAADMIGSGRIDVSPMITGIFPVAHAVEAFHAASDRATSMKVQIQFATA